MLNEALKNVDNANTVATTIHALSCLTFSNAGTVVFFSYTTIDKRMCTTHL